MVDFPVDISGTLTINMTSQEVVYTYTVPAGKVFIPSQLSFAPDTSFIADCLLAFRLGGGGILTSQGVAAEVNLSEGLTVDFPVSADPRLLKALKAGQTVEVLARTTGATGELNIVLNGILVDTLQWEQILRGMK